MGRSDCATHQTSPFHNQGQMVRLCEAFWPPRMAGKSGKNATWVVLFFSPKAMGCDDRKPECGKIKERWNAVQDRLPSVISVSIGSVNCDIEKKFCEKQQVGHMPFVRRYKDGKRKALYDDWDVDAIANFAQN